MENKQLKFYRIVFFIILIVIFVFPLKFYSQVTDSSQNPVECKKNKKTSNPNKKKVKSKNKVEETNLLSVKPGVWGKIGVNLYIQENGARIEYDCADGEIKQKFTIDDEGNFTLNGYYTAQNSGVVDLKNQPVEHPARFEGKISDNLMILKITLTDTNQKLEDVLLERDTIGKIRRCY